MRHIVAVLLLLATPAFAQNSIPASGTNAGGAAPRAAGRHGMQERFEAANTSHDGKLTLEQAKAGRMMRVVKNFDAMDAGKRGFVTVEDIRAFNKAQRAARTPRTP